ncbi:Putative short-chain dehydrogenase/reductase [Mycobacteroides abscessus subsp. massiliense]|nr:3-oxoacyl-[acyl-carrier-protein] reductase [Mycobacteroides abscessus subsp. massiliense]SKH65238.1 3-oxoacyl-[acyl-carrier-protein] reductase [Mycobacteroides abscessus subsp. massiliense]SKI10473.1 3-oxoacyl-[acyl-carrier-protein] reductase [Mycobacteroides abscessus subsp. massiliense]SKJ62635.1 3-oxoacyl-[acyl-carrier-protein] reductase [Mycobacteroides abscessus subsp. massiliense]SKK12432.1 3-oxoacyl-[acyl-carrier-protein] reductase [Mycobacteroides abscessus subsp. massiliense]
MFGTDVRFDGRVAIVTGAGGGLGREYALLLASRGAKVVVNDIGSSDELLGGGSSDAPANSVVAEIQALGGDAIADTNTVATGAGGRAIVGTALSAWGRVDIVINNAGIVGPIKTFAELTDEDVDTVLGVQLLGPFNVLRPAWKAMVDQGYGRILNISSGSMFGQGGGLHLSNREGRNGRHDHQFGAGRPGIWHQGECATSGGVHPDGGEHAGAGTELAS